MDKNTLSVLMCNYNYGKYIDEALESVFQQSFVPIEVIVVDDGSTDNSIEIIEKHARKHKNLKLLRNQENRGVNYSINRALNESKGSYTYWISSDDKILPGFFQRSMDILSRFPQAGLCCAESVFEKEGGILKRSSYLNNKPTYFLPKETLGFLLTNPTSCPFRTYSAIIKRSSLIEAGSYIKELGALSDVFVKTVIALRQGFCYLPEELTYIRIHPDQYGNSTKGSPYAERAIVANIFDLTKSIKYKDVYPMIRRNVAVFSMTPWETLKVVVDNVKYWDMFSVNLLRQAIFDRFIKNILYMVISDRKLIDLHNKYKRIKYIVRKYLYMRKGSL